MNKITDFNHDNCVKVLNDVFDNFDFERVKKTMDALDWKWVDLEHTDLCGRDMPTQIIGFHTPTLDEIKDEAARLMWECANEDIECIARGGFRVEKDFTEDDDPWMRLTFEVTDFDVSYSDIKDQTV